MTTLTIELSTEQFEELAQLAKRFQLTPEDLVRASVDELLSRPEQDFNDAVAHVLRKNADLYRQLA